MVVLLVCRGRRSNGEEAQQHGAQVEHAKLMAERRNLFEDSAIAHRATRAQQREAHN
jgi:hypothetical protein